jgi:hypothetical protein
MMMIQIMGMFQRIIFLPRDSDEIISAIIGAIIINQGLM